MLTCWLFLILISLQNPCQKLSIGTGRHLQLRQAKGRAPGVARHEVRLSQRHTQPLIRLPHPSFLLTCGVSLCLCNRSYNIGKNNEELASLEERLREMEERLSAAGITAPTSVDSVDSDDTAEQRSPSSTPKPEASSLSAPPADDSKSRSRPGTAQPTQQAPSSGDMPPTPGASEGEYYVVTREDLMDDTPR